MDISGWAISVYVTYDADFLDGHIRNIGLTKNGGELRENHKGPLFFLKIFRREKWNHRVSVVFFGVHVRPSLEEEAFALTHFPP